MQTVISTQIAGTSKKDTAHLRHDSGNGIVRCSILYYGEMKEICEGRQGVQETLLFVWHVHVHVRVRVRVRVCVHGRSATQYTI